MKRVTAIAATIACFSSVQAARAIATQDEVFKSINSSVDAPVDPTRLIAGLVMVIAVIVAAVVLTNRLKKRPTRPATINNNAKLLKEVAAALKLRPAQVRQLMATAEAQGLQSPITLLLCPSLRREPAPQQQKLAA